MNKVMEQRCKSCGVAFPRDARANRKYCSDRCSERERKRRYRQRLHPNVREERDPLLEAEKRLEQLEVEQLKLKQKLADRNNTIRNLNRALHRAEFKIESAAAEQTQRTRVVRDELAVANTEVATLRRNWSRKAAAVTDGQEVTELRERLAAVTQSLVAKYRELSEAAQYAATERKHLQGIVRQWDAMCVRLYKATAGRPTCDADKKVVCVQI